MAFKWSDHTAQVQPIQFDPTKDGTVKTDETDSFTLHGLEDDMVRPYRF
jgi:hypothetical protein